MRLSIAIFALFASAGLSGRASADAKDELLAKVRQADVVVVQGSADHMEQVLARAKVNFALVTAEQVAGLPLHGQQVLMVNCTGQLPKEGQERVRRFVRAGGFLYTTDHAVMHLIEPLFPGYIRFVAGTTDEVFPMQTSGDKGLLKHLAEDGPPRWQLASGGHLFEVLDHDRVEVLMYSKEVKKKYGHGALGVRFRVEDGQVIHVSGHFFSQPGQQPNVASAGRSFEQLSENVVSVKQADRSRIDKLYNVAPKRKAVMLTAPAANAAPVQAATGDDSISTSSSSAVQVLKREGRFAKVRDVEGNEGWVEADVVE